jgi:hypothetical protein
MTFGEHVFLYCERGTDAALWAEPINTISNAGFFLAALVAWQLLLWRPSAERSPDHFLLVGLTFLIGCGSLAFHVYADEGTELADIVPIGLFMMVYLGFALNRFLAVPPGWTVLIVIGFALIVGAAMQVQCWDGGIGLPGPEVTDAKQCLNGSVGYLPALGALIILAMLLTERHHRVAPYVVWATIIFIVSIILRSIDMSFCDRVVIDGRNVGTHFIWHILNAVVIFLLLLASLRAGPVLSAAKKPPRRPVAVPAELASVEIVRTEADTAETDTAETGSAKTVTVKAGPDKSESDKKDSAKDEPAKEDQKKEETKSAKTVLAKTAPAKTEPAKDEPKESSKAGSTDEKPAATDDASKEDAEAESKPGDEASSEGKEDESEPDKPEEAEPKMP